MTPSLSVMNGRLRLVFVYPAPGFGLIYKTTCPCMASCITLYPTVDRSRPRASHACVPLALGSFSFSASGCHFRLLRQPAMISLVPSMVLPPNRWHSYCHPLVPSITLLNNHFSTLSACSPQRELNPQDLSFQDFGKSASGVDSGHGNGGIGNSMLKPQQMASVMPDDGEGRPAASGGFWTLKYYQPLFDVDTLQVLTRLKASLLPRPRGVFFDLISTTPDLYGPFWIATTLIFSMAITGNLASFFAFKPTEANPKWTYNFNQLTLAGSVVYSYVTVLPLLLWLLLRYYEAGKRLVDILCIYGYTLGIFVPISVLCVLPSDILRWLLVTRRPLPSARQYLRLRR
uniref:Protein YIPF n=2 Tax=Chrysotila carterae TaxID=13221 RepID=A0A7S4EX89_CHRCT